MSTGAVKIRLDWDRTAMHLPVREFIDLHFGPEPGYPFGRKGLQMAGAWRQLAGDDTPGMLILDGDVAVDPFDVAVMLLAIDADPCSVLTAPARIWPVSTGAPHWVWGHGRGEFTQEDVDDPDRFSFCFTYLPAVLIGKCTGLPEWEFPHVDREVARVARENGIPIRVVDGCSPKHVNF